MRPPVTKSGYGAKAVAIFGMSSLPEDAHRARAQALKDLEALFSRKSIVRKCEELLERGYLTRPPQTPWALSRLTDKGRHALEINMKSG